MARRASGWAPPEYCSTNAHRSPFPPANTDRLTRATHQLANERVHAVEADVTSATEESLMRMSLGRDRTRYHENRYHEAVHTSSTGRPVLPCLCGRRPNESRRVIASQGFDVGSQ